MTKLSKEQLETAFQLLGQRLLDLDAGPFHVVVCGGSALIVLDMVPRTTKDVDVVALIDPQGELASPDPLPDALLQAVRDVAATLHLDEHWLNNGPSRNEGGLFRLGLPAAFAERLTARAYGPRLTVSFIGRLDQIHFKVYAAADRGGYHVKDLRALQPTDLEMEQAARWAMTHDISEGFRLILKSMFTQLGYPDAASRI
jgi:hypothetical protein